MNTLPKHEMWSAHQTSECDVEQDDGAMWCDTHQVSLDYDGPEYDYDPEIVEEALNG